MGGRSAKPYQFMTGGTDFNSDLFGAEHLMVEDEQASTDIRARRHLGSQIKNVTVNEEQRLHAKGRDAIIVRPLCRLTISLNDEPENLMVLPPIEDSLEDKIIILRAHKNPMPMPTQTIEQRRAFWGLLMAELPAFLHFLTEWEIPEHLRSERFGIAHYHDPDILREIDALAPEFKLLSLIDTAIFLDGSNEWTGTSEELERMLTADEGAKHSKTEQGHGV